MRRALLLGAAITLAVSAPVLVHAQQPRGATPAGLAFWTSLGDTTLTRLIVTAHDANRDLRAAEARIGAARAARTEAALDLAPAVTASAGYNRQRMASAAVPGGGATLPDQGLWDAGLQMAWEVDVFGRNRRSLQARSALVAAAEEDAQDAGVIVTADVARAYLELRGTQDRLAVARRNAENQRRTLELTLARLDAGSGTALDSERAQSQLSSTLAEIPMLEAAVAAGRHRLTVLVGSPPDAAGMRLGAAAGPLALPAELDLELESPEAIVRKRADVRSAASRTDAGSALVGSAKAGYLPRLSLSARAGYTAHEFDALGNTGTPRYTFGPVLSWPLLDIGRVKTDVDAARAREAEAAAHHQQLVLTALAEIESSRAGYRSARERLRHLEDAAAASERATDIARLRFEEGGSDFLEVLDVERRQLEAQDRLSAGRTEAAHWLVRMYRAHGG
jgi:outer membrane protein, multidrug efflux system